MHLSAGAARGLPAADEGGELAGGGGAAGGFLREHQGAVDEDVELAGTAPPDGRRHAERCLQLLLEAHGLTPDVQSEEAALDLDIHADYPLGGTSRVGLSSIFALTRAALTQSCQAWPWRLPVTSFHSFSRSAGSSFRSGAKRSCTLTT